MALVEKIGQNPDSYLLDKMVTCQYCRAPMETAGESFNEAPKYVCATKNNGCGLPDIEAEPFNRLILRTVINAILDEENISKVTGIIREEALEESEEAGDAIFEMQGREHRLFRLHEGKPMYDSERDTLLTDAEKESLQKMEAEYLERWEQAGPYRNAAENPRKVRQYSLNLDTYLRPSNISTTRAIMESAVTEILARPGSATINYRLPLPHGGGTKARSSDEVQF
jgi:hypothetical protein